MNADKLNLTVLAQGWIEGRLEEIATQFAKHKDEGVQQLATSILENWFILNEGINDLIQENSELKTKLTLAKSALGFDEIKAQIAKLNNIE